MSAIKSVWIHFFPITCHPVMLGKMWGIQLRFDIFKLYFKADPEIQFCDLLMPWRNYLVIFLTGPNYKKKNEHKSFIHSFITIVVHIKTNPF